MGCPELDMTSYLRFVKPDENPHERLESPTKKTAYSRFSRTVTDDPIGNRITSRIDAVTRSYTSNNLNQYSAITNPADDPTYDDDGNMTDCALSTGAWSYTWDAENRLTSAVKDEDTKLEFVYDYLSRRVSKKVYSWDTDHWSLTTYNLFIYNGYRQVERISVSGETRTIIQRFAWSLDDQLRLIADLSSSTTYSVHHDANRNVSELTAPDGSLAAHYEYAPFGALTATTGSYANSNPFRFSSEYFDTETGLVYYNFRFLSPDLGRFLSKDPIEEEGGWNLYAMVGNNPLNAWDYLGYVGDDDTIPPPKPGAYGPWYFKPPSWHTNKPDAGKPCCKKPTILDSITVEFRTFSATSS